MIDASPGTIARADGIRLKQILFNLLGNALKFTANGTVQVRLSADHFGVHIAVEDDGPGIAPARHDAVFHPFVQETHQTGVLFGGTGLGLAITDRLCRLMHGHITLESAEGQGATFTVTLPSRP